MFTNYYYYKLFLFKSSRFLPHYNFFNTHFFFITLVLQPFYYFFWSDGVKLGTPFSDFTSSISWIVFMHSQQRGTFKNWHQVSSDSRVSYKSYVHLQVHSKPNWFTKFASRFFYLPPMPHQRFFFSRYLTSVRPSVQLYWSSMNYLSVWRFQRVNRHLFSLIVGFTQCSMSYSLPRGSQSISIFCSSIFDAQERKKPSRILWIIN